MSARTVRGGVIQRLAKTQAAGANGIDVGKRPTQLNAAPLVTATSVTWTPSPIVLTIDGR